MELRGGRLLLAHVRDRATVVDNVYVHFWRPGDLLIWTNIGTMHRANPYPVESGRLVQSATLDAEEALAARWAVKAGAGNAERSSSRCGQRGDGDLDRLG